MEDQKVKLLRFYQDIYPIWQSEFVKWRHTEFEEKEIEILHRIDLRILASGKQPDRFSVSKEDIEANRKKDALGQKYQKIAS